jgi:multidrug efflux pump subunit AcrA (membrane-fusion protein)
MWSWVKRAVYALLWLAALAAVLAGTVSYALARYQRQESERAPFVGTTPVQRGDFVVYSDNVGTLEAEESTPVQSETSGQVIGLVPNGTVAKEGDVIVALDVPRMLLELEQDQRNVQEAKDNIGTRRTTGMRRSARRSWPWRRRRWLWTRGRRIGRPGARSWTPS